MSYPIAYRKRRNERASPAPKGRAAFNPVPAPGNDNSPFRRVAPRVGFGRKPMPLPDLPIERVARKVAPVFRKAFGLGLAFGVAEAVFDSRGQWFSNTNEKPWPGWPGWTRTHGPYPNDGMPDNLSPLAFPGPIGGQAIGPINYPMNYQYPQADWGFWGFWELTSPRDDPNPRYSNIERWEVTNIPLAQQYATLARDGQIGVLKTFSVGGATAPGFEWAVREFPFEFPVGTPQGSTATPPRFRPRKDPKLEPRWRPGIGTPLGAPRLNPTGSTLPRISQTVIRPNAPPTVSVGGQHRMAPPRVGTRERKALTRAAVTFAVGAYSEYEDAVVAIHSALPKALQKAPRPAKYMTREELEAFNERNNNPAFKAWQIWKHADEIDIQKAVEALVTNQIEDAVIGGASGKAKQALDGMVGKRPQPEATNPLGVVRQKQRSEWWKQFNAKRKLQRQSRRRRY